LSPQAEKLKKLTDSVDETGDGTKSQWSILGGRFTEGMNEISPRNGDFTTGIWPCHAMLGPVGPVGPVGTVDFPFSERLITRVNLGLIFQRPWFPMVSHGFRCAPQGDVAQILFFGSFQDFWYCEG